MRFVVVAAVTRGLCALAALLVCGWQAAAASQAPRPQLELLTNLFQLRRCAEQQPAFVHPIRIVAEVYDVDCARGALLLRDSSGVEFIRLDFKDRALEPGATVCLEAKGCGVKLSSFGLAVVPGMAVDNDGIHAMKVESGTVFLQTGANPIRVAWFNGPGELGLTLEYEGPDLPRQRIPASVLSRARVDPATGRTNYSAGLDYRCYQGVWSLLPDFAQYRPATTGVATNFDLGVRARNQDVGLEFSGFITIPRDGAYTFYLNCDDGGRLWVGESSADVRVLSQQSAPLAAGQVPATTLDRKDRPWVALEGLVTFVGLRETGGELQMRVGNDEIRVDVFEGGDSLPCLPLRAKVRVAGIYQDVVNEDGSTAPGVLLATSWKAVSRVRPSETLPGKVIGAEEKPKQPQVEAVSPTSAKPVILTVAEIKAMSPDLAKQELPVSIRGVLTAVLPEIHGAVLQDSTSGIFVYLDDPKRFAVLLQRGGFYQFDGVTGPGLFAPVIVPRAITHLGAGQWPQPQHATWAHLVNGSLDTQYAEIDGVVTAVQDQDLLLLTEGGKVTLNLMGFTANALAGYLKAVVRVRGCVFAPFNVQTRELQTGAIRVGDAAVSVLQPAPRDFFDIPQRSIAELLLYDPEAAPFRRLKVTGQIIHGRRGEYFLSQGTNGMRVTIGNSGPTTNSGRFSVGDLVEAAGFLGFGGPVAELKEAVMRKQGSAPLPAPTRLTPDQLLLARYAGTLVSMDAILMNQWREGPDQVLELQSGFLAFRARINHGRRPFSLPASGSRLELSGVYVPLGNLAGDGTVSGFELLLSSSAALRVLATPPWWTLRHVLILAGILAALLCAALVWNKALHRQIQERSRQLETEIHNRERAEQQRAAEAERARIARDLHDELGTSLTEVSLLASAGLGELPGAEKSQDRFRAIAEKARALVSGLDVIVWAIDPRRNSLQSFADYLGGYAEELLSASSIGCRFEIPIECEAVVLPGPMRHSLFLAIKEALNNVLRHASATEVELQMKQVDHRLEIVIADNGCGFAWDTVRRGSGLANLQERLAALNGQCHIESQPGKGTTVKFLVPLARDPG
jgi:signal transduction histidine kinase